MLDIQLLRTTIDAVCQRLATRGYTLDVATFQTLEAERKTLQTRTQELQASRNSLSKQIGQLKSKGEDASAAMDEVAALKSELDANEVRLGELLKEMEAFIATIPNMPHDSVPVGKSESDNSELKKWGAPRAFDFPVKDHVDLGVTVLGLIQVEQGVAVDNAHRDGSNLARERDALDLAGLDPHSKGVV